MTVTDQKAGLVRLDMELITMNRTCLRCIPFSLISAVAVASLVTAFFPMDCHGEGGWTGECQTWVGDHFETRPCEGDGSGGSYSPPDTSRRWERIQEENERIDRRNEQIRRGKELSRQSNELYKVGRYRESLELDLEAIQYLPGDGVIEQNIKNDRAMILVTEARAAAAAGDYSQAATLLEEAMSINPRYAHLWEEEADANLSASYLVRGQDLLNQRKYSEAEEYIADAIKKFSEISGYSKLKEQAFYSMGRALYGQNRGKEAEVFFREAIRIAPGNEGSHLYLGFALEDQGRFSEAEAAYRETLEIEPDFTTAHIRLGVVLYEQGRVAEAEAAYRHAIEDDPANSASYQQLGGLLKSQQRFAEAASVYYKATELEPDNASLLVQLGDVLKNQKRYQEAGDIYRKALVAESNNPDAQSGLQDLTNLQQEELREQHEAAAYRQAIALNPDDADAHYFLGKSLQNQGRVVEAEAEYRKAMELNPGDWGASAALQSLPAMQQAQAIEKHSLGSLNNPLDEMSLKARSGFDTATILGAAPTPVDTRSIVADKVPEEILKSPEYMGLQKEEELLIRRREALEAELSEVSQAKIMTDEQSIGKSHDEDFEKMAITRFNYILQEADKKQEISNIRSQIGMVKVKKMDFIVDFNEKQKPQAGERR